jgi:hypothetical protein
MHATTPARLALAAAAVFLRWLAENGRLRDELTWHQDALHSARTRLDGIAALSADERNFDTPS